MIELTDDQLRAIDQQTQPASVVDPRTGQTYRLIKEEVYQLDWCRSCAPTRPVRAW